MRNIKLALLACAYCLAMSGNVGADSFGDRLDAVFNKLNTDNTEPEILDPDEAFIMSVDQTASDQLNVHWQIADGYYLYRDHFKFEIVGNGIALGAAEISRGKIKEDPDFGSVEVLHYQAVARLPLIRDSRTGVPVELVVAYQGCKEDVICYPPVSKTVSLLLPVSGISSAVAATDSSAAGLSVKLSAQDSITQRLKEETLLFNILVFLGFGLLLAFTPCVLPMIPILSGIIVGQGEHITTQRAFFISLAYVLAMACTYAILGVMAGSFNLNLQTAAQNVWVISVFSGVFVLLALSMFGFCELQLPNNWQNHLSVVSDRQQSGTIKGAAVMGVLSAIIVGPCVAPPLAGALLYISQTGNAVLGGFALLAMGLGMGFPLLVIGTSAGKLLPKAGGWMENVKRVFGVVLLGVAVWFLERILPGPVTLVLWALLLIVTAIYLGALDKLETNAKWQKLSKGLGLAMLLYGAVLIIGAAGGGDDVFRPLQGITLSADKAQQARLEFKTIKSVSDLEQELNIAGQENKAVMLDFYADWCITCKEMEKKTFHDPAVHMALQDVVLLQADVTKNDDLDVALLKKFNLFGPPAILFFDDNGQERQAFRLVGFVEVDQFVQHIRKATVL
ncbi:MAG: protein-disulfide reductase DsbD [Gammaproteobacteria bacterium]